MSRFQAPARGVLAALALAGVSFLGVGAQQQQQQQQGAPPPSPVIARVEGRPITQADFDRVMVPYFTRLRAEMKQGFTEEVRKLANHNVLDELIRRQLLTIEAQREKIPVTEAETDLMLKQDPYFYNNGKFDQAKFIQYKISPGSNYMMVLPEVRQMVGAAKMDSIVRSRVRPSAAAVRAEWSKRNDQVRFMFFALGPNDASLEPESGEGEWAAYYAAHPDQFQRKPRVRLRYLRLPLAAEGDTTRAATESEATRRGKALADSLRAGTSLDSLAAALGGADDTGLFDASASALPGLGPAPEVVALVFGPDADTTLRVVGPMTVGGAVIVGEVVERQPAHLPPLREVVGDVKRRADAEKRRAASETEKVAFYEAHRDSYRTARARLIRVILPDLAVEVKPPAAKAIEQWYARNGASLALPGSASVTPPLDDSLRRVIADRMVAEERTAKATRGLAQVAASWDGARDPRGPAKSIGAVVDTVSFLRDSPNDPVFPASLVDSLVNGRGTPVGRTAGPRRFGERTVVWRVESVDTSYVPPLEEVRRRVETELQSQKRRQDEEDGRAQFEAHRRDYKTKPKYVVDYIAVPIAPPDSVKVTDADLKKYYDQHTSDYRQQEEVRARHILIGTAGSQTPGGERAAKARADSLLGAIRAGADFADLARRFSQDPGSGSAGGDLGFFPRGRMVQEFSDTAFALAPGAVSQLVKTQFGYHIIKVEEKKAAGLKPFDEVRADIRRQLGQARGDSAAARQARALRRRIAGGANPTRVAGTSGGLKTSTPFAQNEPIAGLGFVNGLTQDLETLPVGRWAAKTYRAANSYVLVRNTRRIAAAQAEFDEVKPQAVADAKNAKRRKILAEKSAGIRTALAAGGSIDSLSAPYGGMKDSGLLTRASGFVPFLGREPRVVAKAFDLKIGTLSDTLTTSQGTAWIRVEEKKPRQGASFAKERQQIELELLTAKYTEWVERKKAALRIEILRPDLREKPQPIQQTFTIPGGGQ